MKVNARIVEQATLTDEKGVVEVETEDQRVLLRLTMRGDLFDDATLGVLVECVSKLVNPKVSEPTKDCQGLHCKCMNLDGSCPDPHHGDHDCPHG